MMSFGLFPQALQPSMNFLNNYIEIGLLDSKLEYNRGDSSCREQIF